MPFNERAGQTGRCHPVKCATASDARRWPRRVRAMVMRLDAEIGLWALLFALNRHSSGGTARHLHAGPWNPPNAGSLCLQLGRWPQGTARAFREPQGIQSCSIYPVSRQQRSTAAITS